MVDAGACLCMHRCSPSLSRTRTYFRPYTGPYSSHTPRPALAHHSSSLRERSELRTRSTPAELTRIPCRAKRWEDSFREEGTTRYEQRSASGQWRGVAGRRWYAPALIRSPGSLADRCLGLHFEDARQQGQRGHSTPAVLTEWHANSSDGESGCGKNCRMTVASKLLNRPTNASPSR